MNHRIDLFVSPLQGYAVFLPKPRALPWAGMSQAFGLPDPRHPMSSETFRDFRQPREVAQAVVQAPQGRHKPAQGDALGLPTTNDQALKGRYNRAA
jgi:hypothetical protein